MAGSKHVNCSELLRVLLTALAREPMTVMMGNLWSEYAPQHHKTIVLLGLLVCFDNGARPTKTC